MQANAEVNTPHEEVADFNKPLDHPVTADSASFEEGAHAEALLGARPDVSFKGPPTASCKCLSIAVGQPGEPAFQWSGEQPHTNPDSELVIALTSSGVACPEASPGALGASYWGYEVKGSDVVVVVEPAEPGRPMINGAIIPRPLGGGRLYVRPVDRKAPYGRPASGAGARCEIGGFAAGSTKPAPAAPPSNAGGARIHTDEAPSDTSAP